MLQKFTHTSVLKDELLNISKNKNSTIEIENSFIDELVDEFVSDVKSDMSSYEVEHFNDLHLDKVSNNQSSIMFYSDLINHFEKENKIDIASCKGVMLDGTEVIIKANMQFEEFASRLLDYILENNTYGYEYRK